MNVYESKGMLVITNSEMEYEAEGFLQGQGGELIGISIGVGVAVLMTVLMSVISGQAFQVTEASINSISDAGVKGNVTAAAKNAFVAQTTATQYYPLVILAAIVGTILMSIFVIIASMNQIGGSGGMQGL